MSINKLGKGSNTWKTSRGIVFKLGVVTVYFVIIPYEALKNGS